MLRVVFIAFVLTAVGAVPVAKGLKPCAGQDACDCVAATTSLGPRFAELPEQLTKGLWYSYIGLKFLPALKVVSPRGCSESSCAIGCDFSHGLLTSNRVRMANAVVEPSKSLNVIEHVVLFKFKDGYTEEQELNMYKGLWSFKDYFPTVLAMSLGRVLHENSDGVTHALVMRFGSKESLAAYMADDYRVEVSNKTIGPFFNGELTSDFEATVDVDLSHLYKESEAYQDGVEHIQFFKAKEGTSDSDIADFLTAWNELPKKAQSEIVQVTAGSNYKPGEKYNLAAVMRLPSVESLDALIEEPVYKDLLKRSHTILDDRLRVDFRTEESKEKIKLGVSSL